ncbi:MAG: alkaline phosphatase D family protein [Rhodospirillaceae bacterium]|nr:alkaline phosphatase D family protein [Rhodospirillaceae bacterium]
MPKGPTRITRRTVLRGSLAGGSMLLAGAALPRLIRPARAAAALSAETMRPGLPHGVMSGDVTVDSAVVWSRTDRPARMIVEYDTTDSFAHAQRIVGPAALPETDYTARVILTDLPADQHIFYRVSFQDLGDLKTVSGPLVGRLRTAPTAPRDITLLWSGDTAGQGWGINPDWGGMRIYAAMAEARPDLFIHSGDTIYADGPIEAEKKLPDGSVWRNVVLEGKHKVAETLDEFRANYKYNLMDEHVRRFNAEVAQVFQWDDHETRNNWYPSQTVPDSDTRYSQRSVALLSARAKRAFQEYAPMRLDPLDPERIRRVIHYGPQLDIFVLDMRSYRGPNTANRQPQEGPDTDFLGRAQLRWLEQELLASRATWKIIAADMPIGLIVPDGDSGNFENLANGDGPPLGRELEMARLLRFIRDSDICNTVWLTADVHYAAAHYYDPGKAQFQDFAPFWEFVAGPLNAGTFGPNPLDNTFGPQVMFQKAPPAGQSNLPPSAGLQFFGKVRIEGASGVMTVSLHDLGGAEIYRIELPPQGVA